MQACGFKNVQLIRKRNVRKPLKSSSCSYSDGLVKTIHFLFVSAAQRLRATVIRAGLSATLKSTPGVFLPVSRAQIETGRKHTNTDPYLSRNG